VAHQVDKAIKSANTSKRTVRTTDGKIYEVTQEQTDDAARLLKGGKSTTAVVEDGTTVTDVKATPT
jgi:hypothetical protein